MSEVVRKSAAGTAPAKEAAQAGPARYGEQAVAIAVTLLVTLVRILLGRHTTFCGTPDSCAYLSLGESLSRHQGFTQRFLYQYQAVSLHLPSHGIEYWRPGVSLLLLLAKPFGGVSLHSSVVVTDLAAIALALAAWKLAMDGTANRRIACLSYLLCLVLPAVWSSSVTPDSSLYYGVFAAWFLVLFSTNFRGYLCDTLGLVCVAGVNLIRNDAILLLVPLLAVLWVRRRSGRTAGASNEYIALIVLGFFAAMLPMNLLQHMVLGSYTAGGTAHVLYLTDLSDLSRYGGAPLTLHSMVAHGLGRLIKLRVVTLPTIVYHVLFVHIGFSILFLVMLWRKRIPGAVPLPEFAGGLAFGGAVLCFYGFVLPAIGGFSAMKSLTSLLPLIAVLVIVCIYRAVGYAGAAGSATTAAALAAMTILLYMAFGISEDRRLQADLNKSGETDRLIAAYLAGHGANTAHSLIMTEDAAQFSETTGYAAIPVPSNGAAAIDAAAHDFAVNYILIDQSAMPAVEASLRSGLRPATVELIPGTTLFALALDR